MRKLGVGTRSQQSGHENRFLHLTLTGDSAVPGMEGAGQGTEGGQHPETLQSPLLFQADAGRTR